MDVSEILAKNRREINAKKALQQTLASNMPKFVSSTNITIPSANDTVLITFAASGELLNQPQGVLSIRSNNSNVGFNVSETRTQSAGSMVWRVYGLTKGTEISSAYPLNCAVQVISNIEGSLSWRAQ